VLTGNALDDGNGSTNNYTYVYLYKPSDATQSNHVGYTYFTTSQAGSTFDVTLPETGAYTVYVNPAILDKGTLGLQVKKK
uniref:hypothetical protein n=1 Tax=Methylibium rhizosphaerae TaxID=2570323 RepID=UPI0015E2920A